MNTELREIRTRSRLTQEEAANLLGVSRRTYINYENGTITLPKAKENIIKSTMRSAAIIDETHGVLTLKQIKDVCSKVFQEYEVGFAYLFGSYARGDANPKSDVDLIVDVPSDYGIKFFGLIESLREELGKQVDVLDAAQLKNNYELLKNILKEGIKIYG